MRNNLHVKSASRPWVLSLLLCTSFLAVSRPVFCEQPSDAQITVNTARVIRVMSGGIGASWHAIETPIHGHAGSAWGGNPSPDDAAAWQQLYRLANWLGLDWCRVELEQRMYEPERHHYDWNNVDMRALYRILDWAQANHVDVFLQQMWANVAWNSYPDLASDPAKRVASAPRSMDDFAEGLATLVDHLLRVKHYTCIRWVSINNEPGYDWSWWQGPDGQPLPITPGLAAVRKAFDTKGIRLPLSGPDWTDLPALDPSKIDFDSYIGAYDIHSYWANFDGRKGGYPLSVAQEHLQAWAEWAHARNKPLFLSEVGTMAFGWENSNPGPGSYMSGLKDASLVVRALDVGVDGFNRWSFTNRGDLDGQWQLVDTFDRKSQKLLSTFTPHPNAYYMWGLLSRFTAKHSCILSTEVEGGQVGKSQHLVAAALRSPRGELTLIVVNEDAGDHPARFTIQGFDGRKPLYRYRMTPSKKDKATVSPGPERNFDLSRRPDFQDVLPGRSVSVYSTYHLTDSSPGVIAEGGAQPAGGSSMR